jgi:CheY-like chemotaxis protein
MPGMDGFEMLRALKKPESDFGHLKMVVTSALSADDIQARGGLPEGVTCFQKPVNYSRLELLVHKCFSEKLLRTDALA